MRADGQRDVGIGRVLASGDDEARRRGAQALAGRLAVVVAGDDGEIVAHEPRRLRRIRLDDEVGDGGGHQPFHEPDVPAGTSRGARSRTRDSSHGA